MLPLAEMTYDAVDLCTSKLSSSERVLSACYQTESQLPSVKIWSSATFEEKRGLCEKKYNTKKKKKKSIR